MSTNFARKPHPLFLMFAIVMVSLLSHQHLANNKPLDATDNRLSEQNMSAQKSADIPACDNCGTVMDIYKDTVESDSADMTQSNTSFTIMIRMNNNSLCKVTMYKQPMQTIGQRVKLHKGNLIDV
jgi:hypothetical protein